MGGLNGLLAFTLILEAVDFLTLNPHPTEYLPEEESTTEDTRNGKCAFKTLNVRAPKAPHPANLTDGGLTKLLCSHFTGNVGSHEHADVNAHLLPDDVGNELQPLRTLVYAL